MAKNLNKNKNDDDDSEDENNSNNNNNDNDSNNNNNGNPTLIAVFALLFEMIFLEYFGNIFFINLTLVLKSRGSFFGF